MTWRLHRVYCVPSRLVSRRIAFFSPAPSPQSFGPRWRPACPAGPSPLKFWLTRCSRSTSYGRAIFAVAGPGIPRVPWPRYSGGASAPNPLLRRSLRVMCFGFGVVFLGWWLCVNVGCLFRLLGIVSLFFPFLFISLRLSHCRAGSLFPSDVGFVILARLVRTVPRDSGFVIQNYPRVSPWLRLPGVPSFPRCVLPPGCLPGDVGSILLSTPSVPAPGAWMVLPASGLMFVWCRDLRVQLPFV
ncbi:hypothetical protein V1504DRAFT_277938 [Lipomyces starkeyi]